jgi:acyl-CoA reductase-like NAD-dependent aldehyde dehydrogenase
MISKTTPKLDFTSFSNIINGEKVNTTTTIHGLNPATLEALPEVPLSTKVDIDSAIQSARKAFKIWKKTPFEERKKSLKIFADALLSHKAEFAKLLTLEQGRPVSSTSARDENSSDLVVVSSLRG